MYPMRTRRKLITTAAVTCWVTRLGRAGMPCLRGGGRTPAFAVIAALAALAVPGVPHSAAPASSPVLNWVRQAPATSPHARYLASMAYDAATGTMVLFGGADKFGHPINGTWTWDGATWTKQHPAASPAGGVSAEAYDAATGTVVLFGGANPQFQLLGDTWTWGLS